MIHMLRIRRKIRWALDTSRKITRLIEAGARILFLLFRKTFLKRFAHDR
jgi:hypothetical protein